MARVRGGAWTIGEHLAEGYALTAYCNNPRCGRCQRRQGRALDLGALDPSLTLEDLQARLACVDCGHRSAIIIRTAPEREAPPSYEDEERGSHRR